MDDSMPDNPMALPRVAGIILAAGTGSRMGRTKQLLPFKGKPILAHVLRSSLAADLDQLVLVLGFQAAKIIKRLDAGQIIISINPDYEKGMATSIRTGLTSLNANQIKSSPGESNQAQPALPYDAALFILGDQPLVNTQALQKITRAWQPGKIIVPEFKGRQGNPVLFDRKFFPDLSGLEGDAGGRTLFKRYPEDIIHLNLENEGICLDLDTPKEYEQLCKKERRP